MKEPEELIAEAEREEFEGWDFGYLRGRLVERPAPWDYRTIVAEHLSSAGSLVDIGTGGGEILASLGPLPKFSFAAEGYQPNILVAKRRLRPLGVQVVETFCDDNTVRPQRGALPFKDASIDLVTDRHESFVASEVFRILKPRGRFVTQQVGDSNYPELNDALGAKPHSMPMVWDLPEAVRQLEDAGLEVTDSREARLEALFLDVGAVVYYLKAVPWQIPGFSSMTYHDRLLDLHLKIQKEGPFRVTSSRFLIQATKP